MIKAFKFRAQAIFSTLSPKEAIYIKNWILIAVLRI